MTVHRLPARPHPVPTTFDRRRDRALRLLVSLTQAAMERGDLTPESAAEVMMRCGVPTRIASDVIRNAQNSDPVADWPRLCSVVMPRVAPTEPYLPLESLP